VNGSTRLDFFTELNREHPPFDQADGVGFSLNPSVHATDDLSLMETLSIQGLCVRDAFAMGSASVVVSPLTFRMRRNPNATHPSAYEVPEDEQVDSRQWTPFGLCWLLGSVKYLSESGVTAVSIFQKSGPAGIFGPPGSGGEDSPARLFKLLSSFKKARIIPSTSNRPREIIALYCEENGSRTILAANLTPSARDAVFSWDGWTQTLTLKAYELTSLKIS